MDAWNNYVGRTIQQELGPNATNDQIAAAIKKALDEGRLITAPEETPAVNEQDSVISPYVLSNPDPLVKDIKYLPWVDPLVLDLDGDGLEITPLSAGVQFDTNADTIRTATAWVGADDGLVVLDRNGNGVIDSARELFGDETVLADGKKATHGFAALAELDVGGAVGATGGAGDGIFDAKDAQFGAVRVWRDLNQDGVSQVGELQSMAEAGIASIALASTATETSYGDAQLVQSGSFARADGSEGQAGSFILAVDHAVATHPPIAVSAEAQALPQVQGSGWVRGLQEAATLNPQLLGLYGQTAAAGNRGAFTGSLGELLLEWGRQSEYITASEQALAEDGIGLILRGPGSEQEIAWMNMAVHANTEDREAFRSTLSAAERSAFDTMREEMVGDLEKLYAYEAFTGCTFLDWDELKTKEGPPAPELGTGRPVEFDVPLSEIMKLEAYATPGFPGYKLVHIPEPRKSGAQPYIEMLWNRLLTDAAKNMAPGMRLSRYADMVELNVSDAGVALDFSQMDAALDAASAADAYEGAALFLDIYQTYGEAFVRAGWSGAEKLSALMQAGIGNEAIRSAFAATSLNLVTMSSEGSVNDDSFAGDAGSNTFNGDAGNDFIDGMAGDDTLAGGTGNDILLGMEGADTLSGDDGNDTLEGGAGDDTLYGGNGSDTLAGGEGDDWLFAAGTYGGGTEGSADSLDGGAGNDYLYGGFGSQTYHFGRGDGQDFIVNLSDGWNGIADTTADKQDVLQFKAGVLASDVSVGRSGDDLVLKIIGSADQVTVQSYFSADGQSQQGHTLDAIRFADGTSWDYALVKAMSLQGTESDDALTGGPTADLIDGQGGNDVIYGAEGDDALTGGMGDDQLNGDDGNDTLDGGEGNDALAGGNGSDTLVGGAGDDTLYAAGTYGGGTEGSADSLDGGAGNDYLYGGFGSQTYLFGRGDGQDMVMNYTDAWNGGADPTVGKQDVLQFKAGVLVSDVSISRSGNDLVLTINGSTDQVTVQGYFGDGVSSAAYGLDVIRFDDGTTWDYAQVTAMSLQGTEGDDTLTGSATADVIDGQGGNDVIYGAEGDDALTGGVGDDQLNGDDGDDTLDGGEGADTLFGGNGSDSLIGGAGDDALYAAGIYGGGTEGSADSLDGGAGNDYLYGGFGSQTYLFGRGDGQDTVTNYADPWNGYADPTVGKQDVLQFKAGVLASDVSVSRSGSDLVLLINGSTDQVTVSGYFGTDGQSTHGDMLDLIRFDDGTSWDYAHVKAMSLQGTEGDDALTGAATADVIDGKGGNDVVYGGEGNDTLQGSAGDDQLSGDDGDDALDGGEGNDSLSGGNGSDALVGGEGDDALYAAGTYGGGAEGSVDTLDGGAGNDYLYGAFGSQTYHFGRGDGQDMVMNYTDAWGGTPDTTAGKQDVLQFKAGIVASDISVSRNGEDLALTINGSTDQVTLQSYFRGDGVSEQGDLIETIRFEDGTAWSYAEVKAMTLQSASTDDVLVGGATADVIDGGDGNDQLFGREGDDTLTGGAGDDFLYGDEGDDTYVFGAGDGHDTIGWAADARTDKHNVLQLRAGVLAENVQVTRSGYDLKLMLGDGSDSVTANYFFDADGNQDATYSPLQEVQFADGTVWTAADLIAKTRGGSEGDDALQGGAGDDELDGGAGNDVLYGEAGGDTLQGGDGNDQLYAGEGNDTLDGGAGDDLLYAGSGNNTYRFGRGDGQDTLEGDSDSAPDKRNVLQLKPGVSADDLVLSENGTSLVIAIAGTTDQMTVNWFSWDGSAHNPWNPLQEIRFDDGTVWDLDAIVAHLPQEGKGMAVQASGVASGGAAFKQGHEAILALQDLAIHQVKPWPVAEQALPAWTPAAGAFDSQAQQLINAMAAFAAPAATDELRAPGQGAPHHLAAAPLAIPQAATPWY